MLSELFLLKYYKNNNNYKQNFKYFKILNLII